MNVPNVKKSGEGGKVKQIITVPNLTLPISKMVNSVMKNPVDIQLDLYSSANPELLDPMDLKMMSKLDRLRIHSELRGANRSQDKEIKQKIDGETARRKALLKKQQEDELNKLKSNQKTDTNNGK